MTSEIDRTLLEHLESQEFEDLLAQLAVKERIGKRLRLEAEAVFGEVVDCSILDLALTDLDVLGDEGTGLVQGTYVEAIRAEGGDESATESRRGVVSGQVSVKAVFPKPAGDQERTGYLSDLEVDVCALEWLPE